MSLRHPNWTRILTILLVILASCAVLYISVSILLRFRQAIFIFVLGAIVAYVLTPLVNRLALAFRLRWLAIVLAYGMVAVALFALGVLLFTPFIQQSQSLVDNLRNPSRATLQTISDVQTNASDVDKVLNQESVRVALGETARPGKIEGVGVHVAAINAEVTYLQKYGTASTVAGSKVHTHQSGPLGSRPPPNPPARTQVPPSYVNLVAPTAQRLVNDYATLLGDTQAGTPSTSLLKQTVTDARSLDRSAAALYSSMSTTPILLLRAQTWIDQHHIQVDLHSKFGQVASQLSAQGTAILNNAIAILSETATILLDLALILIISFYLLADGAHLIHRGLGLVPENGRDQAWFFVTSLDKVLGGYIRGQIFLSVLAGILGGGGAAALGVPYPLLIGIMTGLLQLIPVIGPMVTVIPAVAISLFFVPLISTLLLLIWFVVFQQIVTNVISPRVMGAAVGIHPLEAILAVLVGYPLGGILGAFLAVPLMGIVHILIREAYRYFFLGQALPVVPLPSDLSVEQPNATPGETARRTAIGG